MTINETEETKAFWNRVARDWDLQVGDEGDTNRILNSDPVLWKFAGDVAGLTVLDAGCGTGYLARQLDATGANVIGIDFSESMLEIARAKSPDIDFRLDSCSTLGTVEDASIDVLVSNYVLMDTPDLEETLLAFHRVLKAKGKAVLTFSHPCFPQGQAIDSSESGEVSYLWNQPYFDQRKCVDPPWGHFQSEFVWFHRPLSDYWKAFRKAGFDVTDFEEPRISEDRYHLVENEQQIKSNKSRPCSVAFLLHMRTA